MVADRQTGGLQCLGRAHTVPGLGAHRALAEATLAASRMMVCSSARFRACASVVLVVTLIGIICSQAQASATSPLGRATFYGAGDGFTLNDGSCACHKQESESSWLNSRCESGFCFDYIGEASRHSTPALCQHYLPPLVTCNFAHWLAWGSCKAKASPGIQYSSL